MSEEMKETSVTPPVRILPADVYDALELSALAFGGIGGGELEDPTDDDVPYCISGHAASVIGRPPWQVSPIDDVLTHAGITVGDNDNAVAVINARRGKRSTLRVPFSDWCRHLGVVRGAE